MEEILKRKMKDIDGTVKEAEIYLYFSLNENGKKYIIYSFGEIDNKGLIILKVSEMQNQDDGTYLLKTVETEPEWSKIKEILKKVINQSMEV